MAISIKKFRPTGNLEKSCPGVGMPASLYLQQFGDLLFRAYGEVPYQVGSSLFGKVWRDVDVRVMLSPEDYAAMGFGNPKEPHQNERWCLMCMAYSALGQQMTGLPIDFQFQERDTANAEHPHGSRSALIVGSLRRQKSEKANS